MLASCVNRPLRGGLRAVLAALSLALLAACSPLPLGDVQHKPDVTDNIRNKDLLPRFPQGGGKSGQNSGAAAKPKFSPAKRCPLSRGLSRRRRRTGRVTN